MQTTRTKAIGLVYLVLFLIVAGVYAKQAIALSPGSGTWTFSRQGGTLQLTLSSFGDEDHQYALTTSGDAVPFVTFDKTSAFVAAGSYQAFTATVRPTANVKFGEPGYTLVVDILPSDTAAGGGGSGSAITFGVSANLKIVFEATGTAPTIYQSNPEKGQLTLSSAERAKPQVNYLPLILLAIAIILIVGGAYTYLKKRKEEE